MGTHWTDADKTLWTKISELNLEEVRASVAESIGKRSYPDDDAERISPAEWAAIAEQAYRRFLFVCAKYPGSEIVPNGKIDYFWHKHILHTRKYMSDCQTIFGRYLHHLPTTPNATLSASDANWLESQRLFKQEFDIPINGKQQHCTNGAGGGGAACHAMCKSECGKDWPL